MATIYITDETKEKLDRLITVEKRTQSTELDFLVSERMKSLNLPESANPSLKGDESTPKGVESQEE